MGDNLFQDFDEIQKILYPINDIIAPHRIHTEVELESNTFNDLMEELIAANNDSMKTYHPQENTMINAPVRTSTPFHCSQDPSPMLTDLPQYMDHLCITQNEGFPSAVSPPLGEKETAVGTSSLQPEMMPNITVDLFQQQQELGSTSQKPPVIAFKDTFYYSAHVLNELLKLHHCPTVTIDEQEVASRLDVGSKDTNKEIESWIDFEYQGI